MAKNKYLIQYTENDTASNCMPYLFDSEEDAQRYIQEATYFPNEFRVIKAIKINFN